ncbi:MAG: FAD-dependent oxidoreductase, partial [Dehalococcoidia bacterium]
MEHYDVLIVGAGPAGSRTAYRMASAGYKVAIFEEKEQAGHKSCCTGIIGRECADLFDIDVDCVLREAGSARLFAPSGE